MAEQEPFRLAQILGKDRGGKALRHPVVDRDRFVERHGIA